MCAFSALIYAYHVPAAPSKAVVILRCLLFSHPVLVSHMSNILCRSEQAQGSDLGPVPQ